MAGRPPKAKEDNVIPLEQPAKQARQKVLAKIVQLAIGVDLLGSKLGLQATRGNELEVTQLGIKAKSGKNGRVILIPWTNVRGCELYPDPPDSAA